MNRRTFLTQLFKGAAVLAVAPALLRSAKPAGDAPYDPEVLRNTPYVGTTDERIWRENPAWQKATHGVHFSGLYRPQIYHGELQWYYIKDNHVPEGLFG